MHYVVLDFWSTGSMDSFLFYPVFSLYPRKIFLILCSAHFLWPSLFVNGNSESLLVFYFLCMCFLLILFWLNNIRSSLIYQIRLNNLFNLWFIFPNCCLLHTHCLLQIECCAILQESIQKRYVTRQTILHAYFRFRTELPAKY